MSATVNKNKCVCLPLLPLQQAGKQAESALWVPNTLRSSEAQGKKKLKKN